MQMTFELAMVWAALGWTPAAISKARSRPTFEEAREAIEAMKVEAKRLYHALARRYHPDMGGDPETFKLLAAGYEAIEKMTLHRPAPRPQQVVFVVQHYGYQGFRGGASGYTSATTATGAGSVYTIVR